MGVVGPEVKVAGKVGDGTYAVDEGANLRLVVVGRLGRLGKAFVRAMSYVRRLCSRRGNLTAS